MNFLFFSKKFKFQTRVILRKNAEEYINRVEFLKKNLDQLRATAKVFFICKSFLKFHFLSWIQNLQKGKTEQQLIFESVEFLTLKAEVWHFIFFEKIVKNAISGSWTERTYFLGTGWIPGSDRDLFEGG